jgi:hypothetical protein
MSFTIPDKGEGQNDLQSIFFQEYIDIIIAGISRLACVVTGCAVTAQGSPDMTVAVASGSVVSNGTTFAVTGANANIGAADGSNPRLDLVVINNAGAIAVRAGAAAATPKPGVRSANDVVLAVVYVPAADTTISSDQIVDLRVFREAAWAALNSAQTFTGAQRGAYQQLTDGATIAVDLSLANQFYVRLAGNRTLGSPTGVVAGQQGQIDFYQDETGNRTLALGWMWGLAAGATLTLSTTGGFCDLGAYSTKYYSLGTFTVTLATPGVFTKAGHGYVTGQKCQLSTTGALPTGLAAATTYYVHKIDADTFHLSTSKANAVGGTYIATSGAQNGVHTIECGSVLLTLLKDTP